MSTTFLKEIAPDDEEMQKIKNAITAALRWYALAKSRRQDDDSHAVTLIDLLEEINEK